MKSLSRVRLLATPWTAGYQASPSMGFWGVPCGSAGKESACNVGVLGSISGVGRSPGEGNGNPLQYSCLGNPMDGGAWWAAVHGVARSRTRLSSFTFTFHFHALEKATAPTPVLPPGQSQGAWWAAVHGVTKSWTRLSNFTFTFHFHALEKEMATHSSVLAWRIPGTGEPGGLPSMGLHRVGHD